MRTATRSDARRLNNLSAVLNVTYNYVYSVTSQRTVNYGVYRMSFAVETEIEFAATAGLTTATRTAPLHTLRA